MATWPTKKKNESESESESKKNRANFYTDARWEEAIILVEEPWKSQLVRIYSWVSRWVPYSSKRNMIYIQLTGHMEKCCYEHLGIMVHPRNPQKHNCTQDATHSKSCLATSWYELMIPSSIVTITMRRATSTTNEEYRCTLLFRYDSELLLTIGMVSQWSAGHGCFVETDWRATRRLLTLMGVPVISADTKA